MTFPGNDQDVNQSNVSILSPMKILNAPDLKGLDARVLAAALMIPVKGVQSSVTTAIARSREILLIQAQDGMRVIDTRSGLIHLIGFDAGRFAAAMQAGLLTADLASRHASAETRQSIHDTRANCQSIATTMTN